MSDPDGRPTDGQLTLLTADCKVIEVFSAAPGEYRLRIGPDGTASLLAQDVPNDLQSTPLMASSAAC